MFFQEKKIIVAKKIKKWKKKKERKPFNGLPILHSAIIEFREHWRSKSCYRLRLKQLVRFSRALQTSHVYP